MTPSVGREPEAVPGGNYLSIDQEPNHVKPPRIYHPLLFACFPVLFLFANNAEYLPLSQLALPLVVSLAAAGLLMLALGLVFKKRRPKALIMLSLGILLFFSLGPALQGIQALWGEEAISSLDSGQLLRYWLAAFILVTLPFIFIKRGLVSLTRFFNLVGVMLVLLQAGNIAYQAINAPALAPPQAQAPAAASGSQADLEGIKPHIYYIVLDGMGRADVLSAIYGLDSQDFVRKLQKRGFYVAAKARANYAQTLLVMACALNYRYLDQVVATPGPEPAKRAVLVQMIKKNRLFPQLRAQGYRIVAFSSGVPETEMRQADAYLGSVSEFHDLVIRSSLAEQLLDLSGIYWAQVDRMRNRILKVLDELPQPARKTQPTFVFAHLLIPHPPWLLGPEGEHLGVSEKLDWAADGSSRVRGEERRRLAYVRGYRGQAVYIQKRILKVIDAIKAASARPVVIILQGDHGPGSTLDWDHLERSFIPERMGILNAFLLPGVSGPGPYPEISPVNNFRLVLNRYFRVGLPLLPDESFISAFHDPYRLFKVTHRLDEVFEGFRPLLPLRGSGLERPKPAGAPWNAEGNIKLFGFGVAIDLGGPVKAESLEISLDGDDRYRLVFQNQGRDLAELDLAPSAKTGLVVHQLKVPPTALGFDRLLVIPSGGDQRYGLGHLRLPAM
jgi:sulfatase-like protein